MEAPGNRLLYKVIASLAKIRQIDKAVAIKTNLFWVLHHVLCFLNALMNSIPFEFGSVLLVKSTETGLTVSATLYSFL